MKRIFLCLGLLAGCTTNNVAPVRRAAAPPPEAAIIAGGYTLSPTTATAASSGGNGNTSLTTPTWTATSSDPSWLTVTPTTGSGNATFTWVASPNTGPARSATLTIADQIFIVSQAAGGIPPATNELAKSFGSVGSDNGEVSAFDAAGNLIISGTFQSTVNFGTGSLVALGTDIFLCKYTRTGTAIWTARFGSTGNESVKAITQDASGNLFLAGSYSGMGNFGTTNMVSAGDSDAWVAKYSPDGDPLWSQSFGNIGTDRVTRLATDGQGNVIATGDFKSVLTPLMIGTNALIGHSQADVFLAKFSANGTVLWAKSFFTANPNRSTGIDVDAANNVVLGGYFQGLIDFSSSTAITPNALRIPGSFLAKFTSAGGYVNSRALGTNFPSSATAMMLDSNGDVIIGGGFWQHTDLGAGQVFGTSSSGDCFVAKYRGSDFAYASAWLIKGNASSGISALSADAQNNIIVTGFFNGTCNFGTTSLNAGNVSSDGFVSKYSSTGMNVWARDFGTRTYPNASNGYGLALDNVGAPLITGSFVGQISTLGLTSAGQQDVIMWKLNP